MPIVVAQWPDNTVSLIKAPKGWDDIWLFDCLHKEGDPLSASVSVVSGRAAHIGWVFQKGRDSVSPVAHSGRLKPWTWPHDVLQRRYPLFKKEVATQEQSHAQAAV